MDEFLGIKYKRKKKEVIIKHVGYRHTFFGYYDRTPLSPSGRYLLLLCTNAESWLKSSEQADIHMYDLFEGRFYKVATTRAWNFQQGSQQQWIDEHTIVYNDIRDNCPKSIILNVKGRRFNESVLNFHIGMFDPSKSRIAVMNYKPLNIYEKDYSYKGIEPNGENVGTFLDLSIYSIRHNQNDYQIKGEMHLELLRDLCPSLEGICYLQHIKFNQEGSCVIYVVRNVKPNGQKSSFLFSLQLSTGNIRCLINEFDWMKGCNHPVWGNNQEVLVNLYSDEWKARKFCMINALTGKRRIVSSWSDGVGHPTIVRIKQSKGIITDVYHGNSMEQRLMFYSLPFGSRKTLGIYPAAPLPKGPDRCDLHPRYLKPLEVICIDSYMDSGRVLRLVSIH